VRAHDAVTYVAIARHGGAPCNLVHNTDLRHPAIDTAREPLGITMPWHHAPPRNHALASMLAVADLGGDSTEQARAYSPMTR
jgi:hypothetical protein